MRLEDALFNWLQIRLVAEARPDDEAAADTLSFFEQILREDHGLSRCEITKRDAAMIYVDYERHGESKQQAYPNELGEQLLIDIEANPKYN
ncbi:hypothetical protein [Paenibacillus sp. HB172176]|uniref:hypothetical protein n=1 Tax=Paenibacillus sp. HB172176 TaxID=2493690 RepID=UPI00143A8048|nr:hypothetical protein [Paenibacillus sp. HB172176]